MAFEKESRLPASPPEAGHLGGNIPFRPIEVFAERFLFHRTHFPVKQKSHPACLQNDFCRAPFKIYVPSILFIVFRQPLPPSRQHKKL